MPERQFEGPGGEWQEGRGSYQEKVRPGSRPLGLGQDGRDSRPPSHQRHLGPGQGRGERHSPVLGSHSSRSSSSLGHSAEATKRSSVFCGRQEGGVGKRVRGWVSRPQSHLWRCGTTQEMGPGLRHTHPDLLPSSPIAGWVTESPPFPTCKYRLASAHPAAAPTTPGDQWDGTCCVFPF